MSFCHFQTAITPNSVWFRGSSLYGGWKTLREIFPTLPSVYIFDNVRGRYAHWKSSCWSEKSTIPDLSKGKLVFSPIYFVIHFEYLLGVKLSLKLVLKKKIKFKLRAWGREKRKGEGRKAKKLPKKSRTLSVFRWDDPYQGMWDLSCWVNSLTHQSCFSSIILEWFTQLKVNSW